jgi:hypothetical protein
VLTGTAVLVAGAFSMGTCGVPKRGLGG